MKLKEAWKMLEGVLPHDRLTIRWLKSSGHKIPRRFFRISGLRNTMFLKLINQRIYGLRHMLFFAMAVFGLIFGLIMLFEELQQTKGDPFMTFLYTVTPIFCILSIVISLYYRNRRLPDSFAIEQQIRILAQTQKDADWLRKILGLHKNAKTKQIRQIIREFYACPSKYASNASDAEKIRELAVRFVFVISNLPAAPGMAAPESDDGPADWEKEGEDWKNPDD